MIIGAGAASLQPRGPGTFRAMRALTLLLLCLPACDDEADQVPIDAIVDAGPPDIGVVERGSWVLDVEQPPPMWLGGTGIYADLGSLEIAPGLVEYTPPYPLWTNGAGKQRAIYLPEPFDSSGATYVFPVGTVLAKTFYFENIEAREGRVAIETRLLFRRADAWDFALYQWGANGREARLVGGNWPERSLELQGTDGPFTYTLPGRLDCRSCHETNEGTPVIGVAPYNLDPVFRWFGSTEPTPEALPTDNEVEAAVMGWMIGNCVHCHHGGSTGDNASFSLHPEDLVENTVGVQTASSASGDGIRIVAGDVEGSAIYEAVVGTREPGYAGDFKPMPPLGVDVVDAEGAGILRDWIESL